MMAMPRSLRTLCAAAACSLALPASAAGVLFGVVQGGSEPAVGLVLVMRCPNFEAAEGRGGATATVSEQGAYTLYASLNARGKCQVRALRGSRSGPPLDVLVNDGWSRYNLRVSADLKLVVR